MSETRSNPAISKAPSRISISAPPSSACRNSGERAIVPNSAVYTNAIIVKTAFPARRGKIEITVDDPRPATEVRDLIAKLIEKTPGVMSDPAPSVAISNIKGTSMRLTVYLWSPQPTAASDRVLTAVRDAFEAGKAEITAG